MTWLVILALAAIAAVVLLAPLLRREHGQALRADYDREVYRDQLAELERDKARGLIDEAEARSARAEIARRMLATEREKVTEKPERQGSRSLALAIAAAAPVLALALYVGLGSPELPGAPFSSRHASQTDDGQRNDLTQRVSQLATRLQRNPDDLEGWLLLARSLSMLQRHDEAVTAWRQVMRLTDNAAEHAGSLGESLVQSSDGVVTPEARAAFERVRAADPFDPRAMFYLGLAEAQAGNARAALQVWTDLAAVSPENAPWLPTLRERIRRTAAEARIDPQSVQPSPEAQRAAALGRQTPPAPSPGDAEAIQRMSPEERKQAIRGMVEGLAARLEAQPDDLEGWRRLGRAWHVLDERDKAKAAYAKAAALAPERVDVLSDYAAVLLEGATGEALPPDFVALMRRILALDPDYADALWFVGLAEARGGNKEAAIALWEKLLTRLPSDSREHAEVRQQLDRLRSAN